MKNLSDFNYKLTLNQQHAAIANEASKLMLDLRDGRLQRIGQIFRQFAPVVSGQDLDQFDAQLRHWEETYTKTRILEHYEDKVPILQEGDNVLSRKQALRVQHVVEIFARTLMAQFDYITNLWMHENRDGRASEFRGFRDSFQYKMPKLVNGLQGQFFSVTNPEYADAGRIAFDIMDVIRHRISHDDEPAGGWTVNFDKPMNWAKQNKIEVSLPLIVTLPKATSLLRPGTSE